MYKKKSLGQHFLNNQHYLGLIADALEIKRGERVLEIGPGEGALTEKLLERGAQVTAVEKDHRLIGLLQEKFPSAKIIEGDALEVDVKSNKVVGNIPYYITGALLKKFLSGKHQPSRLVFLIQKEVAERIARSKKESILSLSIKAYGTPKLLKAVPRGAFTPQPNVDSAILLVEDISRKNFKNARHEERFFELVRTGFGKKRKLLKSNLKKLLAGRAEGLGNARAEDLSLMQWLELSR